MLSLEPDALAALTELVTTLHAHGIPYQITGGLAGNLHGSLWPLQDIDLEVAGNLTREAALFQPYISWGPARYTDHEFDLQLLRLNIRGVEVDINSIDNFYLNSGGITLRVDTDLSRAASARIGLLPVKVQPLEDLIHYKRLLNRITDLTDLEALRHPPPA